MAAFTDNWDLRHAASRWTKEDEFFLMRNYKDRDDTKRLSKELGRSLKSVQKKLSDLKLTSSLKIEFTPEQKQFLKDNFRKMTSYELSDALGITRTIVRMKMYSMGLKQMDKIGPKWTPEEDAIIIQWYKTEGDIWIAKLLPGRTAKGTDKRRRTVLKLHRTSKETSKIRSKNNRRLAGFKEGNIPPLLRQEGEIWSRKHHKREYYFIKAEGRVHFHGRFLWELDHGPIPKGMNVIFKDGDSLNSFPENLELVDHRELCLRNRNAQKANLTKRKNKFEKIGIIRALEMGMLPVTLEDGTVIFE